MEEHQSRHQLVHSYTQQEQHSLRPIRYHRLLPLDHRIHTWQNPKLAAQHGPVSQYDIRIIKHCRKSLLFHDGNPWIKKLNTHLFDVTMGSFDEAKVCELVGALIQSQQSNIINNTDMGLYGDDGLIIIRNPNGPKLDSYRKKISNALEVPVV